jgi:hypothetical protein
MRSHAHKLGAVFYVLWGVLHVGAGVVILYTLATQGPTSAMARIGSAVAPVQISTGVVSGVLAQHAWNLVVFGFFAGVVGVWFNWKNSLLGYWLNLCVVSAVDLGFIFAIVVPGYMRLGDWISGPTLWVLGAIFSTIGVLGKRPRQGHAAGVDGH